MPQQLIITRKLDVKSGAVIEIAGTAMTSSATELNALDGIPSTLTATELGYVDGVTSAIQTQMNLKAPGASPTFTGTVVIPTPFTLGTTSVTATAANLNAIKGATAAYVRTTAGVQTPLAADASARIVIIVAEVTTVFANGDGAQPTFSIGETDTADKWAATSVFTNAAAGTVKTFTGTLTAVKALIVTAVAATGTTSTGALKVTVLAI